MHLKVIIMTARRAKKNSLLKKSEKLIIKLESSINFPRFFLFLTRFSFLAEQ